MGPKAMIKSPHIKETLASGDLTLRQDLQGSGIGNFFSSVEAGWITRTATRTRRSRSWTYSSRTIDCRSWSIRDS